MSPKSTHYCSFKSPDLNDISLTPLAFERQRRYGIGFQPRV